MMTFRGAVIDVDGTVVRGDEPIPGAITGVQTIENADLEPLFVSNNPTGTPRSYARRLTDAGIDVSADRILTASVQAAAYVSEQHPDARVFVVGEPALVDQLRANDVEVVTDPDVADVLVASIDYDFDYDELCAAFWALADDSTTFLGTDPDMVIPAVDRDRPGSGAVINAIAGVAGREPDRVLGKPSAYAQRMVLDRLDVPAEECLVVGDRLDTDVKLGERAGMTTALVLTGITDRTDVSESVVEPDYVLDSLAEVDRVLDDHA